MNKLKLQTKRLERRKTRIKSRISTSDRVRICIYRSNSNFYAQIIDDKEGKTLVAASSLEKDFPIKIKSCNKDVAAKVGEIIAKRAIEKNIKSVVFDRNGFLYHGKVKAFADSARENGLEF